MTQAIATFVDQSPLSPQLLEKVLLTGDLSGFDQSERVEYMIAVCKRLGLDPITKPFDIIHFPKGSKTLMYANKGCTNQLAALHKLSLSLVSRERDGGLYIVTARAHRQDGTFADDYGAVSWPATTDAQADAVLKAATKAKRRATLAAVGLGMLTQEEIEDMAAQDSGAHIVTPPIELVEDVVQDWIAVLEGATTVEELNGIRKQIVTAFDRGTPQLDALRPEITNAADRIGAVWSNGEYKAKAEVPTSEVQP